MTYEVVGSVWGVKSTWTMRAQSLGEARMRASDELSKRSYGAYIISVRAVPQSAGETTLTPRISLAQGQN
jgi:hypothetical protein